MTTMSPDRLHKIKERLNNGKVVMVNGPVVWTRPVWMMNWWWIDSWMAVLLAYVLVY